MNAGKEYFNKTLELIKQLKENEIENIVQAAEVCADSISKKGLVF